MYKMRLIFSTLAMLFCLGSFAQEMSAKDKKKLQKEMLAKAKSMDPVELQKMFNEYPNMESEINSLNSQVSSLESDLSTKDGEISSLQSKLDDANAQLSQMQSMGSGMDSTGSSSESASVGTSTPTRPSGQVVPGLIYKVQIGAFRNKDLTKYFNNNENFGGEVDDDGTKKYSIGVFAEYWEADAFKKYMREMGVKDAWIVAYYNGKRISMKDAREGVF